MIAIRKLGYGALVLAGLGLAGCGQNPEPAAPAPAGEAAPAASSATPGAPAETKPEAGKETAAPAGDMPKIEAPQPTPATTEPEKKSDGASAAKTLAPDELAEVKKLPTAESDLALKQLVCPVSGENLGSMGVPVKVTAAGRTFFLCCKGCNKDVQDDPAGVVAKLKN
jgi:hypothetical protein